MKPIQVAVIMPWPGCNMFCNFCITEDNFDCMSFDQAVEMLDYVKRLGVKNIVFGGGEPFCWPNNIVRLCEKAKNDGFLVQVGTNATMLNPGFENLPCIDRFVLPIESTDPEIHDIMRNFPGGHHSIIMDCLTKLKNAKKSVTISTVVTKLNKDCLLNIAKFLMEYNEGTNHIHAWHLYRFIPEGRGGGINADILDIPVEEYLGKCNEVKALNLPFHVFRRDDMYNSKTVEFFRFENQKPVIQNSRGISPQ